MVRQATSTKPSAAWLTAGGKRLAATQIIERIGSVRRWGLRVATRIKTGRARLVFDGIDRIEAIIIPRVTIQSSSNDPGSHIFLDRLGRTVEVDPRWLRRDQRGFRIGYRFGEPLIHPNRLARFDFEKLLHPDTEAAAQFGHAGCGTIDFQEVIDFGERPDAVA